MTESNAKLEILRELLYQEPCEKLFEQLYTLFPTGQIEPVLLEYASTHLSTWPNSLNRYIPPNWCDKQAAEAAKAPLQPQMIYFAPACLLCNSLSYKQISNYWPPTNTNNTINNLSNIEQIEVLGVHGKNAQKIITRLCSLPKLTTLQLEHCPLDRRLLQLMLRRCKHKNITHFSAIKCKLNDELIHIIFPTKLNTFTRAQTLNLSSNSIGNTGAIQMAQIHTKSPLKELHLAHNSINIDGAIALIASQCAQILNLSHNNISNPETIKTIKNPVNELYLDHNNITTKGAIAFIKSQCARKISLKYNPIPEEDDEQLDILAKQNGIIIITKRKTRVWSRRPRTDGFIVNARPSYLITGLNQHSNNPSEREEP